MRHEQPEVYWNGSAVIDPPAGTATQESPNQVALGGVSGSTGPQGPPGPNTIIAGTTSTAINALIKGDGTKVRAAVAGTDYPGLASPNAFSQPQTFSGGFVEPLSSSSAPGNNATITIANPVMLVAPTGNVTGIILSAGTTAGQSVVILNNSAFSITFASSGTSKVADGTSDVIAANTARRFVWSGSLWFAEK